MRFQCIVSYRSSGSKSVSNWRTIAQGKDIPSVTADVIEKLKRRQRRPLTVLGVYVRLQEKAAS